MEDLSKRLHSLSLEPPRVDSLSLSLAAVPSTQVTRLDNGLPVVAPMDTLEQVMSWSPGYDDICVSSVPLREQGRSAPQKMIICHDMMGGYINDKFVQGTSCIEDYYFYHWQYIEAFIYFSHHFITLPPPTWTNVAHRHGVLSMGTIITEWKDGATLCHRLFSDELKVAEFAHQLVAMAVYYKFDGWLVNIENNIHPVLLERLYMLLSLLTTGMHSALPRSKVIWYDSVTVNGELKWQNQLNEFNRPFFDMCDGIFLNYNWNEQMLSSSRALAGDRSTDIYVGIDVFGRGCYGGGEFNSYKALEVIHRQGLSSAVFAPGWVFETQDKANFFSNQDRFWSLLSPFCATSVISGLPLVSSFGRGYGHNLAIDGRVVYGNQWSNHSAQDIQSSFTTDMFKNDPESAIKLQSASVDTTLSYNNGACLKLEGSIEQTSKMSKPAIVRLFKTDISMSSPLLVAFTYYQASPDVSPQVQGYKYFIQLHTSGSPSRVFLDPIAVIAEGEENDPCGSGFPRSRDVPNLPGCVLAPLSGKYHQTLLQIFTGNSSESNSWKTCYYVIDRQELRGAKVTQIDVGFYVVPSQTSPAKTFTLTLGEIKVMDTCSLSPLFEFSKISRLWQEDTQVSYESNNLLSLTLVWSVSNNPSDPIDHCNIYTSTIIEDKGSSASSPWQSQLVFLGRAYGTSFRVKDLNILSCDFSKSTLSLEFRVQPVTVSRLKLSAKESPGLILKILT